jgi:hypothetical protein
MQPVSIAILTVKTREDHMEFKLGAHVENERHPFVKVIHPIGFRLQAAIVDAREPA